MNRLTLKLYHAKFGENRSSRMDIAVKTNFLEMFRGQKMTLTPYDPWPQGHEMKARAPYHYYTKFGEDRSSGKDTVAKVQKWPSPVSYP